MPQRDFTSNRSCQPVMQSITHRFFRLPGDLAAFDEAGSQHYCFLCIESHYSLLWDLHRRCRVEKNRLSILLRALHPKWHLVSLLLVSRVHGKSHTSHDASWGAKKASSSQERRFFNNTWPYCTPLFFSTTGSAVYFSIAVYVTHVPMAFQMPSSWMPFNSNANNMQLCKVLQQHSVETTCGASRCSQNVNVFTFEHTV